MYFDFDETHPDVQGLETAMSWREVVLLTLVLHLSAIIVAIVAPDMFPVGRPDQVVADAQARARDAENRRFVFVQPRAEFEARQKPRSQSLSDRDRAAQSTQPPPTPQNLQPFSKGNTPEQIDQPSLSAPPSPQMQQPAPDAGQTAPGPQGSTVQDSLFKSPPSPTGTNMPRSGAGGTAGDRLGEAIRNPLRYAPPQVFDNSQGGGQYGSAIQFDSKGVEFGPWLRRFIAQIKRNWFIPMAAMSMKGHVVVTFIVHKDGRITDLAVIGPCPTDAFNNAAFGAVATSNPTQPLPPEYPDNQARFTVTFFYNEPPDR